MEENQVVNHEIVTSHRQSRRHLMCPHVFHESDKPGYVRCERCGTFHSRQFGDPVALYGNDYWSHGTGHSTIQEQVFNVTHAFSAAAGAKNDKVMQSVPDHGAVALEIACAPGELLQRLASRFTTVFGVEVDSTYEAEIRAVCGAQPRLIFGLFPEVTKRFPAASLDCLIGLDVFEHVPDGAAFIRECQRLLKPGGTLILMSPFIYADGVFDETMYHPVEHVWIYSDAWLKEAFGEQFTDLRCDRWLPGHELFVGTRQAGSGRQVQPSGEFSKAVNFDEWCPVRNVNVHRRQPQQPPPAAKPLPPLAIAESYLLKGDTAEARRCLELAVKLYPDDAQLKSKLHSVVRLSECHSAS